MWLIGTTYGTYDLTNKEISNLTIAGYGVFFFGRLRVPTRRCDVVVPADWWGRSNKWWTLT